jgi:hypothetical protein
MTGTPFDPEAAPGIRDLDASAVLNAVVSARRTADAAEADLLPPPRPRRVAPTARPAGPAYEWASPHLRTYRVTTHPAG